MGGRVLRLGGWLITVARHPWTVRAARGARVQGPARIRGRLQLARGALVFRGLDCVGPVTIGSGTFVNAHAYLRPGVVIGSSVAIGPFVRLITDTHVLGSEDRRAVDSVNSPIVVEDGVWIGAGVTVLPGVRVGRGAVVAAGSLVVRDVAPNTLVAGVPAVLKKELDPSGGAPA